jgi:ethanolaminephosphotransferase
MQPFWNTIVNLYPKWLAPNVLTFTGFSFLVINFVFLSIYDYSFYGYCIDRTDCEEANYANLTERHQAVQSSITSQTFNGISISNVCSCIPAWLWLFSSICQFLSHHLDGTDGKQARRTQSSTPLGELFDHGLDSWATLFLPVALFSIFGRSDEFGWSAFRMYGVLWLIFLSFIVSHWEKYNTGILYLPWSYDLSQLGMTFLFFVTFFVGQDAYYFRLPYFNNAATFIEIVIYGESNFKTSFVLFIY